MTAEERRRIYYLGLEKGREKLKFLLGAKVLKVEPSSETGEKIESLTLCLEDGRTVEITLSGCYDEIHIAWEILGDK